MVSPLLHGVTSRCRVLSFQLFILIYLLWRRERVKTNTLHFSLYIVVMLVV